MHARTDGITYGVESWWEVLPELRAMWPDHYQEVSDHDALSPPDVDEENYGRAATMQGLHIVTMRRKGELVGYVLALVARHLHHQWALSATVTMFWVRPAERKGWRGITLFKVLERTLAKRGVRFLYSATLTHKSASTNRSLDIGPILEFLGYMPIERLYRKRLEGDYG